MQPRGPRRGGFDRRAPVDPIKAKAEQLMKGAGLPLALAQKVAAGKKTLNDALSELARADRVDKLVALHGITRSLAAQVALGQVDLELVLFRKRMDEHLRAHRTRSVFETAKSHSQPITVYLHGHRTLDGRVLDTSSYDVTFEGQRDPIHKLEFKLAVPSESARVIRNALRKAPAGFVARGPLTKPQDRYPCSDKRLFSLLDASAPVQVQTLEGESLDGTVAWVGHWEFGLAHKNAEVVVFRHALASLRELS